MGPSGCGKTTLLKLIGGQLAPEQGQVLFNGYDVHQQSRRQLYELRKHMGLMFQSGGLFTNFNVFDNVAFPLREHTSMEEPLIRDLVLLKLEAVGLRGAKSLQIDELSGGMARRVAMARALALDPALMMYDEPFTGQDPIMMGGLVKLIRHLNDMLGLTSVVVSHDVHETASIADYVYIVSGGRVIGQGAPKKILHDDNPAVYQFMHGLADGVIPFHYPTCSLKEDLLGD
jgi:phospholipid/cholesterol/gamma-HCH transport system ATP-binding protein